MQTIKKILILLTPSERKDGLVLMGMILVMALLDMLGVASILPFMAVLATPELVQTNVFLNNAFTISRNIGINTIEEFLFVLGVIVFVLLVISLLFKGLVTFQQNRFALMSEYSIGKRLFEGYLNQPYNFFLGRHSADMAKTILSEVNAIVFHCMIPLVTLMAQGAVAFALMILLIVVDPLLALSVGGFLVLVYVVIFSTISGWLKRLGQSRTEANKERFSTVSEAFGAAKEVKVGGLEQTFIQRFAGPAETHAKNQVAARVIAQLPRFALETFAFGGMLLIVLYLMVRSGSFPSALPIIALYAFSGYRLIPALQQVYQATTELRFAGPALDALNKDLSNLYSTNLQQQDDYLQPITQAIELKQVSYRYPGAPQAVFRGMNLKIRARSTVGFVGLTGSGKTTAVDLILGLLEPQEGQLCVDGQPITSANRRLWQRTIGYVPQQIYLADDSVAANIAFGVATKDIDQQAVESAAKIANLHEFVVNEMPLQYKSTVGERGVRLSGGQRQRIGIARALYHKPQVLILDEATSALDSLTEQAVMDAVNSIGHEITVILIAHRLMTVKACDTIFLLEKGELNAQGTYAELYESNKTFQKMTGMVL